ncbi:hypothetical protein QL996_04410 [Planococcus sp. APC 4015]|nr:hypothetical protein [Planococcus sp. APC 4015]
MTTGDVIGLGDQASDVVWAKVDDGFYVGSLPGRFLGCIDKQPDGTFIALDVYSRPIGTFARLDHAMTAVLDATKEQAGS